MQASSCKRAKSSNRPNIPRNTARLSLALSVLLVAAVIMAVLMAPVVPAYAFQSDATGGQTAAGSLTLQLGDDSTDAGGPMIGGVIAIYHVASVNHDDGAHYDVSAGQFADSTRVADILSSIPDMDKATLDEKNADIAFELEWEAALSGMVPLSYQTIEDGKVSFHDLEEGLYLVCQPVPSEGGRMTLAFLISIPDAEGLLDVVAQPKPGYGSTSSHEGDEDPWTRYPPWWYVGDSDPDDPDDDNPDDDNPDDDNPDDDDSGDDDDSPDDDNPDNDDSGDDDDSDGDSGGGTTPHGSDGGSGRGGTSSQVSSGTSRQVTVDGGKGDSSTINYRVPQTGDRAVSAALIGVAGIAILLIGAVIGRVRDCHLIDNGAGADAHNVRGKREA